MIKINWKKFTGILCCRNKGSRPLEENVVWNIEDKTKIIKKLKAKSICFIKTSITSEWGTFILSKGRIKIRPRN